jgi:putative thiazole-containing bacteriocin maturation protein
MHYRLSCARSSHLPYRATEGGSTNTMRPKLKGDTFYIPVADGVYLRNSRGPCKIKGKVVYKWLERLVPYLTGEYTLEEITQSVAEEKRVMVTQLLSLLQANGFLKDVAPDHPHTLSAREEQLYAAEIAFIDSFTDSAAYRFEQFRKCRILLIGAGPGLTALVRSNLRPGVQRLGVLATEECFTDRQRHHEYLQLYNERESGQELIELNAPCWDSEAEVADALRPFDVILSFSDRPMLARASMLNRLCRTQQKTCLQAVIVANHAWIGPLIHSTRAGCWECAWRRLQAHVSVSDEQFPRSAFQDHPDEPVSRFLAMPVASVIANELSFEIFKYLSGAGPLETESCLLSIDLETLQTRSHAYLPHPLCSACQQPLVESAEQFHATLSRLEQGERLDEEFFSRRVATCFESHCGLFTSITEADFAQLPLNISQVTVSNPMFIQQPQGPMIITGVGTDVSIPRQRATRRACELYAASIIDQRRLMPLIDAPRKHLMREGAWQLCGTAPQESEQWTWALQLHSGDAVLVPAPLVYPVLRGLLPSEETAPGLASGLIWEEAIGRGLLALSQRITLAEMERASVPFPRIDLDALPLDAVGKRYRDLLVLQNQCVRVFAITGSLQVPTLAFCLGEKVLTYQTACEPGVAARDGLEKLLQHCQSETHQQPEYGLSPVPHLPQRLRGSQFALPTYQIVSEWSGRQRSLLERLAAHGWQAFAVPLHSDPVLSDILPYIVHVLLARAWE